MTTTAQRCCQAADLGLKLGLAEEAQALCQHVLAHHRWHLRAHLLLGQAFLEQEEWSEARRRFGIVLRVDPECAEAYSGIGVICLAQGDTDEAVRHLARAFEHAPESDDAREALHQALIRQAAQAPAFPEPVPSPPAEAAPEEIPPPAFSPACVGRFYLRRGLPQPAAEAYAAALRVASEREDLRLPLATALWQAGDREQAVQTCRPALQISPRPLVALLISAADHFLRDDSKTGQRLWREARAWDPDDVLAQRLFGPLSGLPLPQKPAEVPMPEDEGQRRLLDMAGQVAPSPAPAAGKAARELATYAQRLSSSAPQIPLASDPDLQRLQKTIQEIDEQLFGGKAAAIGPVVRPAAAREIHGARVPAEIILAWEEGLRKRFGSTEDAAQVDRALQALSREAERHGISSHIVYLDRPPYPELPRPNPQDPQQIKNFLDALDRRLSEEGFDTHYLLLIGGHDLLPFAPLPNPSEDIDEIVPSDNLYASRDPTYLIPERAVGRLPDSGPGSLQPFLERLTRCVAHRRGERDGVTTASGCVTPFFPWFSLFPSEASSQAPAERRFGLSAEVWAQASEHVFRVLPGAEPLHLCPPLGRDTIPPTWLSAVPVVYFNLHGALESPNWYGQRDLTLPGEGPLMPVAFSPQQIPAGGVEGTVVYSEACYGAHIIGKDARSSIALRFLAEGALGVVGSTVISYGVSAPPLTDADLLGLFFWQHLLRGETLGNALLQAKIDFTREVYRRQGFLDGDDMKTLLEFVLYGDPLISVGARPLPIEAHSVAEQVPAPPVLCGRHAKAVALHQLSGDLVARVRRSLSWLQQGETVKSVEVTLRSGCPSGSCNGRCRDDEQVSPGPEALVFSTYRQVETEDGTTIPQWARVVVDPRGRIVKMAITR